MMSSMFLSSNSLLFLSKDHSRTQFTRLFVSVLRETDNTVNNYSQVEIFFVNLFLNVNTQNEMKYF